MKSTASKVVLASIALFALACITPCLDFQSFQIVQDKKVMGEPITWFGWDCLYKGLMAIFIGQFAQFANIFYVVALLMLQEKSYLTAAMCSLFALLSGLQTFSLGKMNVYNDDAGVVKLTFLHPNIGFYLWMASFLVLLALSIALAVQDQKTKKGLSQENTKPAET
ncbi:MAG: hypothetical protein SFY67_10775 [Candidatus Melainabacteria bacterium]|nr:hypothetical protein [Candidatus Melainabacteria bacterium]